MDEFSEQKKVQYDEIHVCKRDGSRVATGFLPAERAFLKN